MIDTSKISNPVHDWLKNELGLDSLKIDHLAPSALDLPPVKYTATWVGWPFSGSYEEIFYPFCVYARKGNLTVRLVPKIRLQEQITKTWFAESKTARLDEQKMLAEIIDALSEAFDQKEKPGEGAGLRGVLHC